MTICAVCKVISGRLCIQAAKEMFNVLKSSDLCSDRLVTVLIFLGDLTRIWLHRVQINDFCLWSLGLMCTVSYLVKVQTSFAEVLLCLTVK